MQARRWSFACALSLGLVLGLGACTKSEPAPQASASSTPATATATATVSATATSAAKDAADAGRAAAEAPATADAGGAATAAAECGTKPLPDCPLQAWMKANINPPVTGNDLPALAAALDKVVAFAPPNYPNWGSIAKDGANAARNGDMAAAKASCRGCHDQYKQKYKTDLRGRKI